MSEKKFNSMTLKIELYLETIRNKIAPGFYRWDNFLIISIKTSFSKKQFRANF